MKIELIEELSEGLKQVDCCNLCDSTALKVELYLNEESAFRISCMTCKYSLCLHGRWKSLREWRRVFKLE